MKIDNQLKAQVQTLESSLSGFNNDFGRLESEKSGLHSQYCSLRSQMGWREKYLGGGFGGDKELVQRGKFLEGDIEHYEIRMEGKLKEIRSTESRIVELIASHLITHDQSYQKLRTVYDEVTKVKETTDSYMRKINTALSEIDDAQGMETLDLFTDNKGISVLSSMENSEAQDAIDRVKNYTETFQNALKEYNKIIQTQEIYGLGDVDIGDGIDLVFDLVFDGFDFMSLFTLASLDRAESELKELKEKVLEVQRRLNKQYNHSETNLSTYVSKVRQLCK